MSTMLLLMMMMTTPSAVNSADFTDLDDEDEELPILLFGRNEFFLNCEKISKNVKVLIRTAISKFPIDKPTKKIYLSTF
jgi:hypothetical protein